MNFIKKDKYRHKIIEHLLNQYGDDNQDQCNHNLQQKSSNRQKEYQKYQNVDDISQINSAHHTRGYNMYQKVLSKQKALIIDEQQDQNKQQKNKWSQIKKTNGYNLINKKINKNQQNKNIDKGLNQITQDILQQLKRHQGKETYVYHQNNPILTTTSKLINKDQNKNKKLRNEKQNFPYELNTKINNQKNEVLKSQKKYRFICQNKVHEALQSKRKLQLFQDNYNNNEKEGRQNIQQQRNIDENIAPSITQRSKGSQEMMKFLQSARQKLFISNNTDQQMFQHEIHNDKNQDQKQQQDSNNYFKRKIAIKNDKKQILDEKFQIQIQISPNKNRIIQLTQNSNPIIVAKQFISQNKQQLSKKGFFNKKMEGILAERIQMQIQHHKKLSIQQKQKDLQQKYKKIIHELGVREDLLQDDQENYDQDKVKSLNRQKCPYKQNKETTRKKYRKQSFSHVYVQNIESTPHEQQSSSQKSVQIRQAHKLNEKTKKQINLKQKNDPESDSAFQGYFNSPHQLITYRQKCSQNEEELQPGRTINEYKNYDQETYQHFPISKCTAQFKSLHKNLQNFQIKDEENIGASKILSRSRQKRKLITINSQIHSIEDVRMTNSLSGVVQNQKQVLQKNQIYLDKQKIKVKDQNKSVVNCINSVSQKIIKSIGKQNILNGLKIKQQQKRQKILKYKESQQLKELQQCSFKPKINKLSQSIQKNKKKMKIAALISMSQSQSQIKGILKNQQSIEKQNNEFKRSLQKYKQTKRYDDLYKNHKTIEAKKQYIRRKSIEQIPFRPDINLISTKIMETKRNSLNNSMCQFQSKYQSQNQSVVKPKDKHNMLGNSHYHCVEDEISKGLHKKRKSMQFQRNRQGLQIGDYLYKEAMRLKNKRESAPQILSENFKPLQKSEKIINKTKQKRLSELFNQLVKHNGQKIDQNDNQKILCSTNIDLSDQRFTEAPFKYIVPLLQQLQQLEVILNRQEFIQSGLKLLSYLSQDERSQVLLKKYFMKNSEESNKENLFTMNKLSKKLVQNKLIF